MELTLSWLYGASQAHECTLCGDPVHARIHRDEMEEHLRYFCEGMPTLNALPDTRSAPEIWAEVVRDSGGIL